MPIGVHSDSSVSAHAFCCGQIAKTPVHKQSEFVAINGGTTVGTILITKEHPILLADVDTFVTLHGPRAAIAMEEDARTKNTIAIEQDRKFISYSPNSKKE